MTDDDVLYLIDITKFSEYGQLKMDIGQGIIHCYRKPWSLFRKPPKRNLTIWEEADEDLNQKRLRSREDTDGDGVDRPNYFRFSWAKN